MPLPHVICPLDASLLERWAKFYARPASRDPRWEEGLWRRTQDPRNAEQSGWNCADDQRRRIFHYRYRYDVMVQNGHPVLALVALYLMYCVTYPRTEVDHVTDNVADALARGSWRTRTSGRWQRGPLEATLERHDSHPEDDRAARDMPPGYRSLQVTVRSSNDSTGPRDRDMPWDVLRRGMRIPDSREEPVLVDDLSVLERLRPFHIEVGCGVSIESGVPPLHSLHDIYKVTEREANRFIFDPARDTVVCDFLADPETTLDRFTHMYRSAFLAEPSEAHRDLKALAESGSLTGPVMTNNFDCLLRRAGLEELHLRRYDQDVPHVDFDPRAQALLVIGSHADRRRVQRRARARGMKIVFLDPEGYWTNGRFASYPLEGTQEHDLLCRSDAAPALRRLVAGLMAET